MWFVYILHGNKKDWYYVGSTNDLQRRLSEHNAKKVRSTKAYTPLVFAHTIEFVDEKSARLYEQKLKKSRKEKEYVLRTYCQIACLP